MGCLAQPVQDVFKLRKCGTLPLPREMHGAAVVGDRLYILGGHQSVAGRIAGCVSALIAADGSLSSWRNEAALPDRLSYIDGNVQVIGNRIYIVGGGLAPVPTTSDADLISSRRTLWAQVGADGSITEWKVGGDYPGAAVFLAKACATGSRIYLTGGKEDATVCDQILVCDVSADGSPGAWRSAGKLPLPLWFHGASILENTMYVWGGLSGRTSDKINSRVFSAKLQPDGALGAWHESLPMPEGIYSSGFCGDSGLLVSLGGRYKNAYPTNVFWLGSATGDDVSNWKMHRTDMEARLYHAIAFDQKRGWVFITGGKNRSSLSKEDGMLLDLVQGFQLCSK